MSIVILTPEGQVTLPASVRTALGLNVGDRVEFFEVGWARYEIIAATLPVTALKGLIFRSPRAPVVSVEAMNEAIRRRASCSDVSEDAQETWSSHLKT